MVSSCTSWTFFSMLHDRFFCWRIDFRGDIVEDFIFIFINFLFSPVSHLNDESFDNLSSETFSSCEKTCSILDFSDEALYDVIDEDGGINDLDNVTLDLDDKADEELSNNPAEDSYSSQDTDAVDSDDD